jgi:hypothetical protein
MSEKKVDKEAIVKKFRHKLIAGGHSLKWWHRNYIPKLYKYAYFIRQLNDVDCMQESLWNAIGEYVG